MGIYPPFMARRRPVVENSSESTRNRSTTFVVSDTKLWGLGSKRRLARIRLRGNWPRPLPLLLSLLAILLYWVALTWALDR
jgi:hypothetical protein